MRAFDDPARHARALKARGDHGDADLIAHVRVDHRAEDQVHIRVSGLLDDGRRLVDLEQGQVGPAGDIEQDAAGAIDGDVQQLAGDSLLGRHAGASSPLPHAHRHQRRPAFRHDRAHVGEVQVDQAGHGDQLGDALHALAQHIIRHAESILQVSALVDDLQQAVVGDDDQRIGLLLELGNASLGRLDAPRAFKGEGPGDHADGQRADFLGDLRHDGRGAGAGAAAHAGGDEDHVGAFQHLVQVFAQILRRPCGLAPGCRPSPARGSASRRCAPASGAWREQQRLGIGVDRDELHTLQAFLDHAVDGIAAAAAHAHHLDAGKGFELAGWIVGSVVIFGSSSK